MRQLFRYSVSVGGWTVAIFDWALAAVVTVFVGLLIHTSWRRIRRQRHASGPANLPTLTTNWVLVALPTVLASAVANRMVGLLLTAVVAFVAFWKQSDTSLTLTWPCAILPAVGCVTALRPNPPATVLTAVLFVLGCILVVQAIHLSASKASAVASLVDGVGLFLVASVVLWLLGVRASTGRTAGLENSLTGDYRVIFPLSNSLFLTSAMAAVYLASAIPLILLYRKFRLARLAAVLCAFGVLILTDTRAALVIGLFLSTCALLAPRLLQRGAPILVGGSLVLPFIYGHLRGAVGAAANSASSFLPGFNLRAGEDPSTLNSRSFIWERSLYFYTNHLDWFHQAFGHGTFGHAASDASSSYATSRLTGLASDSKLITPHNSMLQLLLDGGWVAAGLLAVTMVLMAIALRKGGPLASLSGLAMLVALSLVGVSEVALSPSHAQLTWWVLLALGVIAFAHDPPPSASQGVSTADDRVPSAHSRGMADLG